MKTSKLILSVITFFLFLGVTSCVSTNKGFQSSPVISRNVELDPIKADIKVNEDTKLKGMSSSTYLFGFKIKGENTFADGINYSTDANVNFIQQINPLYFARVMRQQKVRAAAAYNAMESGDYDFMVHPTYVVTVKNYLIVKKYDVTVTGYGATYTNFRTEKDTTTAKDININFNR